MSERTMADVIDRAANDPEFRAALRANPRAVLVQYELTAAELHALASGSRRLLRSAGLDDENAARPMLLWRGKDEAGVPGNTLNPQHVRRPSTTEAGVAARR